LRNDRLRQRQTILELKSALAALQGQHSASAQPGLRSIEGEILKEELQVTNEELRASREEL